MKKVIFSMIGLVLLSVVASADGKPVAYEQLPAPAKAYVDTNFGGEKIAVATKDDDFILPDYNVLLANGTMLEFSNSGRLKKITSRSGIPADLVPVTIRDYVAAHYPGAGFVEFEVDRKTYEVKLTNRMELKFNSNFNVIEVDY